MRNKRIISAWNKIEPDSAADARMLDAILARNPSGGTTKMKEVFTMSKTFSWKRLAPIAACLVTAIAVAGAIGNNAGWFDGRVDTVAVGVGTLQFYKSKGTAAGNMDFGVDIVSRELTAEENKALFGDLPVITFGSFDANGKNLLHVEGKSGNVKVILAAPGIPVTDAVIETGRKLSEINGIQVSAGYFITRANSQGIKNIIYIASFEMNGISMYVECGGNEAESQRFQSEIASVIDTLTQNTAPDLSKITA